MPSVYKNVYLHAVGHYLPGEAIDNDAMDAYIAPISSSSNRIKKRILAENGIETRHYGIDAHGNTVVSHAAMAAEAIKQCLSNADLSLADISLLAAGSSGGDAILPGFADMIHGELAAQPMETLSSLGVCASGVKAMNYAALSLEQGHHDSALVVSSEMPSRLFKSSRFEPQASKADFGAHFLRWMLSDGAGAFLLTNGPRQSDKVGGQNHPRLHPRLKVKWIHQVSFAGDFPTCMQMGMPESGGTSYLDYPSCAAAEQAGALSIRQDIRLLPNLFDVSIHEYAKLCQQGYVDPKKIDHFLCHYSSAKFEPVVETLLEKAGLAIPKDRWYSNLRTRGNTGAASIFIMLSDFLAERSLNPGETILCFVPESGRVSAAYILLEVEAVAQAASPALIAGDALPEPPHKPGDAPSSLQDVLWELASIWQDYRSAVWRTPVINKLVKGEFTQADYLTWMAQWIPQVRQGTRWMRGAIEHMTERYAGLADLIETHAGDEQDDFMILYEDYVSAGGDLPLDALSRNPGGEGLNAFLHSLASRENPVGLLGAIYIIEGTGQRIVPMLLPLLKQSLSLPASCFRFLEYHGHNDEHHLQRWLKAVEIVLTAHPEAQAEIVNVARQTAMLYQLQFDYILGNSHERGKQP